MTQRTCPGLQPPLRRPLQLRRREMGDRSCHNVRIIPEMTEILNEILATFRDSIVKPHTQMDNKNVVILLVPKKEEWGMETVMTGQRNFRNVGRTRRPTLEQAACNIRQEIQRKCPLYATANVSFQPINM